MSISTCFCGEIRNTLCGYLLLSRVMLSLIRVFTVYRTINRRAIKDSSKYVDAKAD